MKRVSIVAILISISGSSFSVEYTRTKATGALFVKGRPLSFHLCTGTRIGKSEVLTAASCLFRETSVKLNKSKRNYLSRRLRKKLGGIGPNLKAIANGKKGSFIEHIKKLNPKSIETIIADLKVDFPNKSSEELDQMIVKRLAVRGIESDGSSRPVWHRYTDASARSLSEITQLAFLKRYPKAGELEIIASSVATVPSRWQLNKVRKRVEEAISSTLRDFVARYRATFASELGPAVSESFFATIGKEGIASHNIVDRIYKNGVSGVFDGLTSLNLQYRIDPSALVYRQRRDVSEVKSAVFPGGQVGGATGLADLRKNPALDVAILTIKGKHTGDAYRGQVMKLPNQRTCAVLDRIEDSEGLYAQSISSRKLILNLKRRYNPIVRAQEIFRLLLRKPKRRARVARMGVEVDTVVRRKGDPKYPYYDFPLITPTEKKASKDYSELPKGIVKARDLLNSVINSTDPKTKQVIAYDNWLREQKGKLARLRNSSDEQLKIHSKIRDRMLQLIDNLKLAKRDGRKIRAVLKSGSQEYPSTILNPTDPRALKVIAFDAWLEEQKDELVRLENSPGEQLKVLSRINSRADQLVKSLNLPKRDQVKLGRIVRRWAGNFGIKGSSWVTQRSLNEIDRSLPSDGNRGSSIVLRGEKTSSDGPETVFGILGQADTELKDGDPELPFVNLCNSELQAALKKTDRPSGQQTGTRGR